MNVRNVFMCKRASEQLLAPQTHLHSIFEMHSSFVSVRIAIILFIIISYYLCLAANYTDDGLESERASISKTDQMIYVRPCVGPIHGVTVPITIRPGPATLSLRNSIVASASADPNYNANRFSMLRLTSIARDCSSGWT